LRFSAFSKEILRCEQGLQTTILVFASSLVFKSWSLDQFAYFWESLMMLHRQKQQRYGSIKLVCLGFPK